MAIISAVCGFKPRTTKENEYLEAQCEHHLQAATVLCRKVKEVICRYNLRNTNWLYIASTGYDTTLRIQENKFEGFSLDKAGMQIWPDAGWPWL